MDIGLAGKNVFAGKNRGSQGGLVEIAAAERVRKK